MTRTEREMGRLAHLEQILTYTLTLQRVPDIAVEVIIAREEQPTTEREGYGRDATDDALVGIGSQFLVCPQVEEAAGGVV